MTGLPNPGVRSVQCAGTCGQLVEVSWSSSCENPDGTPQAIWCGTCYMARWER